MTEAVRDQYGEPWLLHERSGSQWVLGLDDARMPIVCATDGRTFHVDLSSPRGVREISPTGWQPISTAPKDGTPVLAYARLVAAYGDCLIGVAVWKGALGWKWLYEMLPTHWQPLPEPPA